MTPHVLFPPLRRLFGAGALAVALIAAAPGPAQAVPAAPVRAVAAAGPASPDQKLAVAVKFGRGDDTALLEKSDCDFVIGLWKAIETDDDHLEVRAAAVAAFSAADDGVACYDFIATGVFTAADRDVAREVAEAEAKRLSDEARSAAAASIDVVADAALLSGTDAKFVDAVWDLVVENPKWPKVKAAARAARDGSDEDRRQFIAAGMAQAAKQDVDDRILADERISQQEKLAALARAAKKLAANRIGLTVTDELVNLPDRDFVVVVWNNTADGSEVQAAAVAASRSLDPAVWKAYIETGVHEAVGRYIQIALDERYQADRAAAQEVKAAATDAGDLNLAY